MHHYFSPQQRKYWTDLIVQFNAEDAVACAKCCDLRGVTRDNAKNCQDKPEVATAKGRVSAAAYAAMFLHLADDNFAHVHGVFTGAMLPRAKFIWSNGAYLRTDVVPVVEDAAAADLDRRLLAVVAEGVPCHYVGPATGSRQLVRPTNIEVSLYITHTHTHTNTHTHTTTHTLAGGDDLHRQTAWLQKRRYVSMVRCEGD
jgi:hypothetical protein